MPVIRFTKHLKKFFPDLVATELGGRTVREAIDALEPVYPGIRSYILDDAGALRKHVNIFVDGTIINDRTQLTDAVEPASELFVMQALSGG